jgi:hypothetical protein
MADILDYAAPMMRIEKCLKEMHDSLLNRNMPDAHLKSLTLIVEARILCNTLTLMQEKEEADALRQQTPPV